MMEIVLRDGSKKNLVRGRAQCHATVRRRTLSGGGHGEMMEIVLRDGSKKNLVRGRAQCHATVQRRTLSGGGHRWIIVVLGPR
jgi:hypothetical protein